MRAHAKTSMARAPLDQPLANHRQSSDDSSAHSPGKTSCFPISGQTLASRLLASSSHRADSASIDISKMATSQLRLYDKWLENLVGLTSKDDNEKRHDARANSPAVVGKDHRVCAGTSCLVGRSRFTAFRAWISQARFGCHGRVVETERQERAAT